MSTTGTIHDVGYAPYIGPRLPPARRFWVIARNVVGVAWRSRWGVKLPVFAAIAGTVSAIVAMYVLRHELTSVIRMQGLPVPRADEIIFYMVSYAYVTLGFVLALTVACGSIADDLRSGAFQFYFSRPIRPRDYVLGKLCGIFLVVGIPMLAGPLVLALVRLLMADSLAQAAALAGIVPKALALGLVGTAALALPAAAIGALLKKRQPAAAVYAIYYLVVSGIANAVSDVARIPWVRLVSTSSDMVVVGRALFGLDLDPREPPAWSAALAVAAFAGFGLWIVLRRVRRAEISGLGGG